MRKTLSLILTLALALTLSLSAFAADSGAVYEWTIDNVCAGGNFENAAAGELPKYDHETVGTADLTTTGGWFANPADIPGIVVENEGFGGGKALKLAGNGTAPFGAAYWLIPDGTFADKDVIAVSFLYKPSETFKNNTLQLHGSVMAGSVYNGPTDFTTVVKRALDNPLTAESYGFDEYVGTPVGDGWYRVTGSVACETLNGRRFVRLFADFGQFEAAAMGTDGYVLIDDVQVGKAVPAVNADAAENKSSVSLILDGDFEDRFLGDDFSNLDFDENGPDWLFDDLGWGSNRWDFEAPTFQKEANNMVLRIAGNGKNGVGAVGYKMPTLTAGKTYRLAFDYKFIADTAAHTMQAHVSLMANAAKQQDNPGGWYTINLIQQPGYDLGNGYKRVEMDFTPSAFEVAAFDYLRFFIQLGGADAGTGIYFDNVALYDIANADPLPDEVQAVIDQINGLKAADQLTEADKPAVKAAYDAYQALSAAHKAMVPADQVCALNAAYEKLFGGTTNPTKPTDPILPTNPTDPTNPTTPTEPTTPTTPDAPETGVATHVLPICLLGAAALTAMVVVRKKH